MFKVRKTCYIKLLTAQTRRFLQRSVATVKGRAALFSVPLAENAGLLTKFLKSKQNLDPRIHGNKGNNGVSRRKFQVVIRV